METIDVNRFLLKPEDAPEVAEFIAELVLPYLDAEPELLRQPARLTVLANISSLAWNISRLERRPEGAGLARRNYSEIVTDKPPVKVVLDEMLGRARTMDWYSSADVKILVEGDTLIISAVQHEPLIPRPPVDGQVAN